MIEPLRLAFDVACRAEHAFRTWTGSASAWWPLAHTVSSEEGLEIVFEPRAGGRIFERTPAGREIEWGEVTAWEPPRRVRYRWWIAADPEDATDVEILFKEVGASKTRVEIEHGGWERLGEKGVRWRDVNQGGWDGVLPAYIAAAEANLDAGLPTPAAILASAALPPTKARRKGAEMGGSERVGPPTKDSRGDWYDSVYERRAAAGEDVHGEAHFVMSWEPASVLDAGCGTGRVGRELARRGVAVVGVDIDPEMLETARRKAPDLEWVRHDLTLVDLGRQFDAVLMAGNVINFVLPERRHLVIANLARHLPQDGLLIDGHSLKPADAAVEDYDVWAAAAGLKPTGRWSTWDRDPFQPDSDFAVSVFRKT